MNVLEQGAHSAANWIVEKVREHRDPLAVFVTPAGALVAVAARTARRRAGFMAIGTYRAGLHYREVVEDMAHLAQELKQGRAAA